MSNRTKEARDRVSSSKERSNFRQTKVWKDFRTKMKKIFNGKDYITQKPLQRNFNLHHLDQRKENYENLDESRFVPLCKSMHDAIHTVYRYYEKDEEVLDRFCEVIREMKEMSND